MGLTDYISISYNVTIWLIYLTINLIFNLVRNVIWLFNGTYSELRQSRRPENYAKSAHVRKVVFMHRVDEFVETRLSDYCLVHDKFVSPEYVLKDEVNLLQVTPNEAIFIERKKGARPMEDFAFSVVGVTDSIVNVIVMPLQAFNKLAESMPPCEGKILFLHNQARCGGTLFTEMFKSTGRCITHNEPHALNGVCKQHYITNKWDRKMTLKMLRNTVRVLCKTRTQLSQSTLCYVIKPTCTSTICADLLEEALPDAIQFFIYRDPVSVAVSLRRIAQILTSLKTVCFAPNLPNIVAFLFRQNGYSDVDFRGWTPKTSKDLAFGFRLAATTMMRYLMYRKKGIKIHGIRYEVLRDNKEAMTEKIFVDICGLPKSLVPKGIEAFGRDSQEASPISMAILKKAIPIPPKPSPEALAEWREMCRELDVPQPSDYTDLTFTAPGSVVP